MTCEQCVHEFNFDTQEATSTFGTDIQISRMGRGTYSLLHAHVAKQSPVASPRLAAFAAVLCVKAASHTHEMYSRQRARLGGLLPFAGASPDDAVFEEVEEEREREKQRERGVLYAYMAL